MHLNPVVSEQVIYYKIPHGSKQEVGIISLCLVLAVHIDYTCRDLRIRPVYLVYVYTYLR